MTAYATDMSETRKTSRLVGAGALAGVAAIAAVVSYLHALAVVRSVGAAGLVEWLIPFLADLVIVGASASLLDAARNGQRIPRLPVASLAVAIAVTLAMNVAAGLGHGVAGALVAGWPAVAFILSLESLAGIIRRSRGGGSVPDAAGDCVHEPAGSLDEAILAARPSMSIRALADAFEVPKSRVEKALRTARDGAPGLSVVPEEASGDE